MEIIGIAGLKKSGKDTVGNYLATEHNFTRFAFADPLKAACREIFGFSEEQLNHPEVKEQVDPFWGMTPRYIMQRLGTEGVRQVISQDVWIKSLLRRTEGVARVVVTDVRFEDEAEAIRSMGGALWLIERPMTKADQLRIALEHSSERLAAQRHLFDSVITNDGSIADLNQQIDRRLLTYRTSL